MKSKKVLKPRVIEVEQDGEYIAVEIEVKGQLLIGKYMRYGWCHGSTAVQDEVQRLLSSPRRPRLGRGS